MFLCALVNDLRADVALIIRSSRRAGGGSQDYDNRDQPEKVAHKIASGGVFFHAVLIFIYLNE